MEAQITASSKSPVLSAPRTAPEGSASEKSRKRESESHSHNTERDGVVSICPPATNQQPPPFRFLLLISEALKYEQILY